MAGRVLRGKKLLSETFDKKVTSFRDLTGGDLLDPIHPWRPPRWLGYYPKRVIASVVARAIKLNSRQGRRHSDEQDAAAADVVAAYAFLTGSAPRELAHDRGSSQRRGTLISFIRMVERIYRVPLISANSGTAWTRVLAQARKRIAALAAAKEKENCHRRWS